MWNIFPTQNLKKHLNNFFGFLKIDFLFMANIFSYREPEKHLNKGIFILNNYFFLILENSISFSWQIYFHIRSRKNILTPTFSELIPYIRQLNFKLSQERILKKSNAI